MPVNVRILAASGKNVAELVKLGRLRLDLYYRINTIVLDIPPLRERAGDIPVLARHIADMICGKLGRDRKELAGEFLDALMNHDWPGNIRELGNILERAILIARDDPALTTRHLDSICFQMGKPASCFEADKARAERARDQARVKPLRQVEQEAIAEALRITGHNCVQTANLLGIHRNTLRNKMRDLGL
jgi:transcriptional regulator with PAS, ATPase and Fis domain